MDRDVPATSAGPPDRAESANPSAKEPSAAAQATEKQAAPAASSSGAEPDNGTAPDSGWQAVETESETRWKRKE
jgi:hypothetical protein